MNYRSQLEQYSLGEEAKSRICAALSEETEHKKAVRMTPMVKRLLAVGTACALVLAVGLPIGLTQSGKGLENLISVNAPFGGGALGTSVEGSGNAPQLFSPYICAYTFERNEYPKAAVEATLYFGANEQMFRMYWEQHEGIGRKEIVSGTFFAGVYRYNLMLTEEERAQSYAAENESFLRKIAQASEAPEGVCQSGICVYDKFSVSELEEFPFEDYCVELVGLEAKEDAEGFDSDVICGDAAYNAYYDYAKSMNVTIPEELFCEPETDRRIDFFYCGCLKFSDGTDELLFQMYNDGPPCFFYSLEGDSVRLSKTKI